MDLHIEVPVAVDVDDAAIAVSHQNTEYRRQLSRGEVSILVPRALLIVDNKVHGARVEEGAKLGGLGLGLGAGDVGDDLLESARHVVFGYSGGFYRGIGSKLCLRGS